MATFIGFHIPVDENDLPEVDNLQMCILNPQDLFDKTTKGRIPMYKATIARWKAAKPTRKMFVHGSYSINLSNTKICHTNALKNQLRLANEIGADGLVIHCGKSLKDNIPSATNRFFKNITKVMDRATEQCPLIIETCVGAGTELFWELKSFENMIITLGRTYGKRIGCCIDTAHIWGAGYDPLDFITCLSDEAKHLIRLIHWNNSKVDKGSRVDRHASINEGKINPRHLWGVAKWAIQCNIPLVIE